MQPTSPERVGRILKQRPGVTLEHIRAYDRLLMHRANINPNRPLNDEGRTHLAAMNEEIRRLHDLLYG